MGTFAASLPPMRSCPLFSTYEPSDTTCSDKSSCVYNTTAHDVSFLCKSFLQFCLWRAEEWQGQQLWSSIIHFSGSGQYVQVIPKFWQAAFWKHNFWNLCPITCTVFFIRTLFLPVLHCGPFFLQEMLINKVISFSRN